MATATKNEEYYVVKANDLIQNTRYNLSVQQQKIILYAVSKIRPLDPPSTEYEFSILDFCHDCGYKVDDGGYYYASIRKDIKELTRRQWCTLPDGDEMTISWIGDAKLSKRSGTVKITFNPHMGKYLFYLCNNYTQYRLGEVLKFDYKYSIRLYELCRSHYYKPRYDNGQLTEVSYLLDDIRNLFMVKYARWTDLKRFVIDPSIEEINEKSSDLTVGYVPYYEGKKVIGITLRMRRNPYNRFSKLGKKLDAMAKGRNIE